MQDETYRLQDGQVQMYVGDGVWVESAHNEASLAEVLAGDYDGHSLLPLLREKYGLQAS